MSSIDSAPFSLKEEFNVFFEAANVLVYLILDTGDFLSLSASLWGILYITSISLFITSIYCNSSLILLSYSVILLLIC